MFASKAQMLRNIRLMFRYFCQMFENISSKIVNNPKNFMHLAGFCDFRQEAR